MLGVISGTHARTTRSTAEASQRSAAARRRGDQEARLLRQSRQRGLQDVPRRRLRRRVLRGKRTPVCSSVKDTFNLLSDAIAAVLRSIAAKTAKPVEDVARDAELQRHVE